MAVSRRMPAFDPLSPVPTASFMWDKTAASDNSGSFEESTTHRTDSEFPLGVTQVLYTAMDNAGNKEECSFNVYVAGQYV